MFFFNKKYHLLEVVKKQAVAKITDFNLLEFLKLLHFLLEKLVKNNLQGLSHSFLSADNHWAQKPLYYFTYPPGKLLFIVKIKCSLCCILRKYWTEESKLMWWGWSLLHQSTNMSRLLSLFTNTVISLYFPFLSQVFIYLTNHLLFFL